jgi:heterodisulfide reductase subunit B
MRCALFLGCTIPARLNQYETSSRAVLETVGVELADTNKFNCCGYPLRNIHFKAFVLASVRNLAIAEKMNLNIMTLCKCCYGSLKKADHLVKGDISLRKEINDTLKKEGLKYDGDVDVTHILQVIHDGVGIEAIKKKITKSFKNLKIATHYGCHALRPSSVVQFDDPVAPALFDELVEVTGAESIYWPTKLECCGAPVFGINDDLSMSLTDKKIADGKQYGADYLCAACPYCHIQFDTVQKMITSQRTSEEYLPCILYPQLLGLSLGIDSKRLGLDMNQIDIQEIEGFLSSNGDG